MSVNPTVYDLQQDERISTVEGYVSPDFPVPEGPEYSYPVVGQPMSDLMWQYVTLGLGDGVLDEGGQPYWFRGRENQNDTVRITVSTTTGTAQALLRGFYHRMTADKTFTVPAVSTTTVYHFCLTYNPVGLGTADGPISLQMYAGTPPTTQGRFHLILWTLTRKPSQLLTDATYQRVRPKIAPTITVDELSHRPDVSKVLWGTQCYVANENGMYRAIGSSDETGGPTTWSPVSSPSWTNPGDTSTYKWPGHGYRRGNRRIGDTLELRGRIGRVDGGNFINGGGDGSGYLLYTLTSENQPAREQRFICAAAGISGQALTVVTAYTNGEVRGMPVLGSSSWLSLDGIRIALKE